MRRKERKKEREREIRRKRKSKKAGWVGLDLATTKKDCLQEWTLCVLCSVYTHFLLLDGETLFKASIRYR